MGLIVAMEKPNHEEDSLRRCAINWLGSCAEKVCFAARSRSGARDWTGGAAETATPNATGRHHHNKLYTLPVETTQLSIIPRPANVHSPSSLIEVPPPRAGNLVPQARIAALSHAGGRSMIKNTAQVQLAHAAVISLLALSSATQIRYISLLPHHLPSARPSIFP